MAAGHRGRGGHVHGATRGFARPVEVGPRRRRGRASGLPRQLRGRAAVVRRRDRPAPGRVRLGHAVVNRMDELALLLAGPADDVVLKSAPDPGFLALPAVARARTAHGGRGHPAGPRPHRHRGRPGRPGACSRRWPRWPHRRVPAAARRLGPGGGAAPGGPGWRWPPRSASVAKAVNSKVYSRRVAAELGLRQPAGWACETLEELDEAVAGARRMLAAGRRGRGEGRVRRVRQGPRGHRRRRAGWTSCTAWWPRRRAARGQDRIGLVVEEWVGKRGDLSYQFTVGPSGAVGFDFVRRGDVTDGVHQGTGCRPGSTAEQAERTAPERRGARRAAGRGRLPRRGRRRRDDRPGRRASTR